MLMKVLVNGDWVTVCDFSNSGINENSLYVDSNKNAITNTLCYRELPGGLKLQAFQVTFTTPTDKHYLTQDIDIPKPFSEMCMVAMVSATTTGNSCYCLNANAYPRSKNQIRIGMRHLNEKNLSGTITAYVFCVGK